jgi:hypothetical protein
VERNESWLAENLICTATFTAERRGKKISKCYLQVNATYKQLQRKNTEK